MRRQIDAHMHCLTFILRHDTNSMMYPLDLEMNQQNLFFFILSLQFNCCECININRNIVFFFIPI